jgi:hypothetical protein
MSWYVKRTLFRCCENGERISQCYHRPRCARQGAVFGRVVTGWTGPIRSERQAGREAAAWQSAGWATVIMPSSRDVRAAVRAWEASRR